MLKLVLDTNTLVSAFFWEGNEAELFRKIEQGKARLYISNEIIKEIKDVISRPKFKYIRNKVDINPDEILNKIISISHIVVGNKLGISISRDKKDDKFLECAKLAKADYLVSGDKDLLVLNNFENINIVRTTEILKKL